MKPETTARLDGHGRLVIPVELRRQLGLGPGDEVVVRLEEGELRIRTRERAIRRAQELVRRHVGAHRSLSDELIRERRAEA